MSDYKSYSIDELMGLLGEKINQFTVVYFESDDPKAIRRMRTSIREIKEEINTRMSWERKRQASVSLNDLGLYRSEYRNTTV